MNTLKKSTQHNSFAPIVTLLLFAPFITEVLFGSTRLSILPYEVLPEIGVWGCGALIIREIYRRSKKNWISLLIFGLALACAEELIIQQTSLAPLIGTSLTHEYGRWLGVNWTYFLWALIYESVWVVVIPVTLTEMIFPKKRNELWLGKRGLTISSVFFVLGAFAAWYSWRGYYLPKVFPAYVYHPPFWAFLLAAILIAFLIRIAFKQNFFKEATLKSAKSAPHPLLLGIFSTISGILLFGLLWTAYNVFPSLSPIIAFISGIGYAFFFFWCIKNWSERSNWNDIHRLSLIMGTIIATAIGGFATLTTSKALPFDRFGQLILNVFFLSFLIWLSGKIKHRPAFKE